MSFTKRPGPPRDVTRELTQAFQLSNFCRDLTKVKIIPGTRRVLGGKKTSGAEGVEEDRGGYGKDGLPGN